MSNEESTANHPSHRPGKANQFGFAHVLGDGTVLHLKVTPRASRSEISDVLGHELRVKVTAPPVDSAANQAVLELLSDVLACPRRALQLVKGRSSRHKQVMVEGFTPSEVVEKLKRACPKLKD